MRKFSVYLLLVFLTQSCYQEDVYIQPTGKLSKISTYAESSAVGTDKFFYYNQSGQIAKEVWKYTHNGEERGEIIYSYNSDGQLVEKDSQIYGRFGKERYTYDSEGKVIDLHAESGSFEFQYDHLERLIYKKLYRPQNGEKNYSETYQYKYDTVHINNITEEIIGEVLQSIGTFQIDEHLKYYYNNNNQLEQKVLVDGSGWLNRSTKEFFEYDNQGRIIRIVHYDLHMYFDTGSDYTDFYYYYD